MNTRDLGKALIEANEAHLLNVPYCKKQPFHKDKEDTLFVRWTPKTKLLKNKDILKDE